MLVEQQLRLLSSCAKGLSPAQDTFTYADPDTPEGAQRTADMNIARSDSALAEARHNIVGLLRETMSYWSIDPELSDVRTVPSNRETSSSFPARFAGHKRPHTFHHFTSSGGHINIAPASSFIGACVFSRRSAAHGCVARPGIALGGTTRTAVFYFIKDRTRRRHKTTGGSGCPEYCCFVHACAPGARGDGRGVPYI